MTQMENFLNRLAFGLMSLLWGGLCGYLSVFELRTWNAIILPPTVFWFFYAMLAVFLLRENPKRLLFQLILFLGIYLLVVLVWFVFTISMFLGFLLVCLVVIWGLKIDGWRYLVWGSFGMILLGLIFDFEPDFLRSSIESLSPYFSTKGKGVASLAAKMAIFLWQTIAITTISLQLHAERLHRQHLATQPAAEGGAPEP